jgi:hypothetical protein
MLYYAAEAEAKGERSETCTKEVNAILKVIGEGYPFPTNLDRRPRLREA